MYWILTIVCSVNTLAGWLFLKESYAPTLLARRKKDLEQREGGKYTFKGEDQRPMTEKLATSLYRPLRIFIQPIVLIMATYMALIFATTYSMYTNFQDIYGKLYGFSSEQVGLMYLGPGLGCLTAVLFLIPHIDTVYNKLSERNHGKGKPEFRLPLTNVGAVLIPASLFWFAWTVERGSPWPVTLVATYFYGIGQVSVVNTVQNYFIDSFEKYAASAVAAGALFRMLGAGIVPLVVPPMFEKLGYGWGISVFGFMGLALAPAPLLFWFYGERIRERFEVEL